MEQDHDQQPDRSTPAYRGARRRLAADTRCIVDLPDPVGWVIDRRVLPNGLQVA